MKKKIHPKVYEDAVIRCACGFEMRLRSTKKEMRVEVCSHCHPFYKGEKTSQLIVDVEGRIEKFKKKYGWK